MITSKQDLKEYMEADRTALTNPKWTSVTWRYLKALRKAEYFSNVRGGVLGRLYRHKLNILSKKTGICIPINTFGKGLGLFHYGTIIVNTTARFGDHCVIQTCVVVSVNVQGGDYVYIAPGVKIGDDVNIADHVILGMNAVVTKDINESGTSWGGAPAKKISDKGFYG